MSLLAKTLQRPAMRGGFAGLQRQLAELALDGEAEALRPAGRGRCRCRPRRWCSWRNPRAATPRREPPSRRAVHADQLGVLAADLDDAAGLRHEPGDRGGLGHDLVHEHAAEQLGGERPPVPVTATRSMVEAGCRSRIAAISPDSTWNGRPWHHAYRSSRMAPSWLDQDGVDRDRADVQPERERHAAILHPARHGRNRGARSSRSIWFGGRPCVRDGAGASPARPARARRAAAPTTGLPPRARGPPTGSRRRCSRYFASSTAAARLRASAASRSHTATASSQVPRRLWCRPRCRPASGSPPANASASTADAAEVAAAQQLPAERAAVHGGGAGVAREQAAEGVPHARERGDVRQVVVEHHGQHAGPARAQELEVHLGDLRAGDVHAALDAEHLLLEGLQRAVARDAPPEPPGGVQQVDVASHGEGYPGQREPPPQQGAVEALRPLNETHAVRPENRSSHRLEELRLAGEVGQEVLLDLEVGARHPRGAHEEHEGAGAAREPRGLRVEEQQVLDALAPARRTPRARPGAPARGTRAGACRGTPRAGSSPRGRGPGGNPRRARAEPFSAARRRVARPSGIGTRLGARAARAASAIHAPR